MGWGLLRWAGVVVAGFAGAGAFYMSSRIARDMSLLVNSDVFGAAIGAGLTILGALTIDAARRRSDARRRVAQLRRALKALKGVADQANTVADIALPIHDRANATATLLGALGGGREMVVYALQRIELEDVGMWLKFETLDRAFARFDEQRELDKAQLTKRHITEQEWADAHRRMTDFASDVGKRLDDAIALIDRHPIVGILPRGHR